MILLNSNNYFSYIFLTMFFIFYFTVGSSLMLPFGESLRWLGPFILLIIGVFSKIRLNKIPFLWPKFFNLLLPTFITSIFVLNEALIYGISKLLSFLLVISGIYTFLNRENFKTESIITSFTIMSYILNFIMVYQFYLLSTTGFDFGRFQGSYGNPNLLTSLSLSATVASLWFLARPKKNKFLAYVFLISNIIVIIGTGSRIGLIGLIFIILGALFIFSDTKSVLQKMKLIAVIIIVGIVFFIMFKHLEIPALERILSEKTIDNSTGISRGETWQNGLVILLEKPLFGWGFGSANYYTFISDKLGNYSWGVHNSYIAILIENGLVGTIFYILFAIIMIKDVNKKMKLINLSIKEKRFIKILILLCAVLLINGVSETFLFSVGNPMAIPFWYSLLALNVYLSKKIKSI